jgi:hypothetical protein
MCGEEWIFASLAEAQRGLGIGLRIPGRTRFELVERSASPSPRQLEQVVARLGPVLGVGAVDVGLQPVTLGTSEKR